MNSSDKISLEKDIILPISKIKLRISTPTVEETLNSQKIFSFDPNSLQPSRLGIPENFLIFLTLFMKEPKLLPEDLKNLCIEDLTFLLKELNSLIKEVSDLREENPSRRLIVVGRKLQEWSISHCLSIYGPCPRCGSKRIGYPLGIGTSIVCENCGRVFAA